MYNVVIIASGGGSNALQIIKHFEKSSIARIDLIVSNNSNAGVRNHALNHNIDFIVFDKNVWHNNPEAIRDELTHRKIDLIVLAGFLLLVPPVLIRAFPNRILNIHPALLPQFGGKGMYGHHVHKAVKASGKKESGITIHLVNEKYDEGEIIFQAKTPIDADDTAETIQKKVLAVEHEWYPRVIASFIKERMK